MTSLAFILGVVPLVVSFGAGAEMRQSLGTAVFFGMLGVTFFGLVFTPVFYVFTTDLSELRSDGASPKSNRSSSRNRPEFTLETRHASITHSCRARLGNRSGGGDRRPPDHAIVRRKRPRDCATGAR